MRDSTVERYALAEQHRAPLRDIGQGYAPSEIVRITRYKAGQVVEIIERTVTQSRAVERVVFKQSAAKSKALKTAALVEAAEHALALQEPIHVTIEGGVYEL